MPLFVDVYLNNARYNNAQFLIGKTYLAIIASGVLEFGRVPDIYIPV